jgi:hypothetical protein
MLGVQHKNVFGLMEIFIKSFMFLDLKFIMAGFSFKKIQQKFYFPHSFGLSIQNLLELW